MTALLLALLCAAPQSAAVTEFQAPELSKALARTADALLISQVRKLRPGWRITSGADVSAVLSNERQRQLLGCTDESCTIELVGALGVDVLVTGRLGLLAERILVEVRLVDARTGLLLGSATQQADGEAALPEAIAEAAAEVLPFEGRPRWPGVLGVSLGSALAVGGAVGLLLINDVHQRYLAQQQPGAPLTVSFSAARRAEALAPWSVAGLSLGVALLGGGLAWLLWPSKPPGIEVALSPLGGAVSVTLRW